MYSDLKKWTLEGGISLGTVQSAHNHLQPAPAIVCWNRQHQPYHRFVLATLVCYHCATIVPKTKLFKTLKNSEINHLCHIYCHFFLLTIH